MGDLGETVSPAEHRDPELDAVASELLRLDPDGGRTAQVIRETLDQLLDGQRTGRWDYRRLRKTEKTHMGTLVELNVHREFEFEDGDRMDYRIAGADVDCKFSVFRRGWQIPIEAVGHICLLLWADDEAGVWSGGLIRAVEEVLRPGGNRDRKRTLNAIGLSAMRRLWDHLQLPENLLLRLDDTTRAAIFAEKTGQRRTDELFRRVRNRIISRTTVLTVAQQADAPKRVRDARHHLRPEGIVVLGHQGDHPRIARRLALPIPRKGEWVSTRLVPAEPSFDNAVSIAGVDYRVADDDDPPSAAPRLDARRAEL